MLIYDDRTLILPSKKAAYSQCIDFLNHATWNLVQYKEIAHLNEVALKQLESAHQDYKAEVPEFYICYIEDSTFILCMHIDFGCFHV